MNILTFGVKIDPSGAESGSRAARAAMDKLKDALADVKKAAGAASDALGKTSDKGAFGKITGAATAAARAVTGAFSGMVRAVTGTVTGITKALGSIGLALDGLRMITAPLRGFLGDVIGNAADMETFRNQWAYILGSVDKAREKMASLQKFANETPFDLPGVTQAALMMADLKDAALAGEAGLKRVGDAAARANQPIQELASRITRLSGNLERGAGGGDELRALTEWRIFRPAAAARISDLSTDAGNFKEAMKIVVSELNRSENAMKLMAVTWKGLTSTMSDSWGALKTAIGEPLLEGLKPLLVEATKLIDGMTGEIRKWAPAIKEFGLNISAAFKLATSDGGLQLSLRAAADLFIELLKRGFEILGKMLMNIFEVIGHKFMEIMKRIASFEFWEGVGRALVNGVKAALEALKGSVSDDFLLGLGFEPQSFKDATAKAKELQSIADELAGPYKRQNDPARYANYGGTTDEVTFGPNGEAIHNVRPNSVVRAEEDINTIVRLHQRLAELERPSAKWEPAPGPDLLSPFEINESLGPLPQTDAMREYQEKFGKAYEDTLSVQDYLKHQTDSVLQGIPAGGPEATLFPGGEDPAAAAGAMKDLADEAERWATAVQTPQEALDATLAKLEQLRALGPGKGGLTDEQYMRAVKKAHEEYAQAVESAGEKERQAVEKATSAHQKLLNSWKELGKNIDQAMVGISESITTNIAGALTDLITGAKSAKEAFSAMASSIVRDIVNITMKLMVQYFYAQLLGMIPGTGGFLGFAKKAMGVSVMHTGGIVGGPSETRSVGAETFAGAVRYHTGGNIGRNEVPAILEKGETVLTKEQASGIARRLDGRGGSESAKPANVTIINLSDPNAAQAELARNPDAILNLIAGNLPKVREMVHKKGPR